MGSGRDGGGEGVCFVAEDVAAFGDVGDVCGVTGLVGIFGRGREGFRRTWAVWDVFAGEAASMFVWLEDAAEEEEEEDAGEEAEAPRGVHCQGGVCEYVRST